MLCIISLTVYLRFHVFITFVVSEILIFHFKTCIYFFSHPGTDRHHYFKSGNIPKAEGGHIHLSFVTVL